MKKQEESAVINTMGNNSQQNTEENHLQQNGKVDNTLIWIQAFMPLLGALFIGGTVAMFLINSVILYFDCEKLKKAGYDVEELGDSWIVPVYIYKRAEYFNHGKGYFIVWCIAFGISFSGRKMWMSEKRWERLRRKNLRQRRNNCWGNKQGIKIYGNEYS